MANAGIGRLWWHLGGTDIPAMTEFIRSLPHYA